jgi:hypothetical protein
MISVATWKDENGSKGSEQLLCVMTDVDSSELGSKTATVPEAWQVLEHAGSCGSEPDQRQNAASRARNLARIRLRRARIKRANHSAMTHRASLHQRNSASPSRDGSEEERQLHTPTGYRPVDSAECASFVIHYNFENGIQASG